MTDPALEQWRREVLGGVVTTAFYETVYLPFAASAQARAVDTLIRVSKGKVTASVVLGTKAASAPLSYRVLADVVAAMPQEQLDQFVATLFDHAAAGGVTPA